MSDPNLPGIGNVRSMSVDELVKALVKGPGGRRNWADRYAHIEPVIRWFKTELQGEHT